MGFLFVCLFVVVVLFFVGWRGVGVSPRVIYCFEGCVWSSDTERY